MPVCTPPRRNTTARRIDILLPCARVVSAASRKTVCYSGCLTKFSPAMIFVYLSGLPARVQRGRPVIFRLDMQLGIDKQTNHQNSGRRGAILISSHFRQAERERSGERGLDCLPRQHNVYRVCRVLVISKFFEQI